MTAEQLTIAAGTVLTVISRTDEELEIEARYDGEGTPPPAHLHPSQDEHFEVIEGAMTARIDGRSLQIRAGESLDVPRGAPHLMWNGAEQAAAMRWVTTPAGRTLDWFRELAAVHAGEPLSDPETLLSRYEDVFRLAGG